MSFLWKLNTVVVNRALRKVFVVFFELLLFLHFHFMFFLELEDELGCKLIHIGRLGKAVLANTSQVLFICCYEACLFKFLYCIRKINTLGFGLLSLLLKFGLLELTSVLLL